MTLDVNDTLWARYVALCAEAESQADERLRREACRDLARVGAEMLGGAVVVERVAT